MTRALAIGAAAAALAACRTESTIVEPDPHLERMLVQPKDVPYGTDPILPRGMAMQRPPEGTLPVGGAIDDPVIATGALERPVIPPAPAPPAASTVLEMRWATHIPVPVDRAFVEKGRARFELYCAPCHGILGDGDSVVATRMNLRRPPNLDEPRIRAYPPGRIFATIRGGYGLMPSYAVQLPVEDAWAVTAYVRALQIARGTPVAALPASVRDELAREAPR